MARHLHHVDHVHEVILRIAESQRTAQLLRLTAIVFYLCLDTLLIELSEVFIEHLLVTHIVGIGDHLHVMGRRVVVQLLTLLNALITGEHPLQEFREPCLQRLRVFLREGGGTLQQLHGIEHLHKRIGIDDTIAAPLAVI